MMDRYLRYDVGLKGDIWMLGCVLFILCFAKHPFEDGSSLAITSAQYNMPNGHETPEISDNVRKLIKVMLTPDPKGRPSIDQVIKIISNLQEL